MRYIQKFGGRHSYLPPFHSTRLYKSGRSKFGSSLASVSSGVVSTLSLALSN